MKRNDRIGIFLLNMGGPDSPEAVEPFLLNLFNDRKIIRLGPFPFLQSFIAGRIVSKRLPEVRSHYERMGGGSPQNPITREIASALAGRLSSRGIDAVVEPAMRYWHPFAADAVRRAEEAGCARFLALSLYPQYSRATTSSSLEDLKRHLNGAPLKVIDRWYAHPGYVECLAESVRMGMAGFDRPPFLLVSAHGLPQKFVEEGDPYVADIWLTLDALLTKLDPRPPYALAFQSRVGPVRWTRPHIDEVIRDLGRRGIKDVLVLPISFVTDHVETLVEIDHTYGELARSCGIEHFRRAPSLNARPSFIEVLADLVSENLP
jgi:ferrochelatase